MTESNMNQTMKPDTYYLIVNGRIAKYSKSLDNLLKWTPKAYKPEIVYNGVLVWKGTKN